MVSRALAGWAVVAAAASLSGACTKLSAKRLLGNDDHREEVTPHGESSAGAHGASQSSHGDESPHHGDDESPAAGGAYLAAISPIVTTPVIPQCKSQHNAPRGQLAPSYFEEMQACSGSLPPQLRPASKGGRIDENGDCNLGNAEATEVVCHYHSGFEFTSLSTKPAAPRDTVELHCIAFKLAHGERVLTPIVFGTQMICKKGTLPGSSHVQTAGHGGGHGAAACGERLSTVFEDAASCDMRCCRDGTLTKANPGMAVRPSFAICANAVAEVDCGGILANMHAHPPHRPHDRVGPQSVYGKRLSRRVPSEGREDVERPTAAKAPVYAPFADNLDW